jgi:hypothetical protein
MIPKSLLRDLIRGGNRFSEQIMHKQWASDESDLTELNPDLAARAFIEFHRRPRRIGELPVE